MIYSKNFLTIFQESKCIPPSPRRSKYSSESISKDLFSSFTLARTGVHNVWKKWVQILVDFLRGTERTKENEESSNIENIIQGEVKVFALANLLFGNPLIDLSDYCKRGRIPEYIRSDKPITVREVDVLRKNLLSKWLRGCLDQERKKKGKNLQGISN